MTLILVSAALLVGMGIAFVLVLGINVVASRISRNAPKGDDLVEMVLMKTGKTVVLLQHDKYTGKLFINVNGRDDETMYLPHLSLKMRIVFVPKTVKGIDRIEVIRPLLRAYRRPGWTYIVTCGDTRIERVL